MFLLRNKRFLQHFRNTSERILFQNSSQRFQTNDVIQKNQASSVFKQEEVSDTLLKSVERRLSKLNEEYIAEDGSKFVNKTDKLELDIVQCVNLEQIKTLIRNNFRQMQSFHLAQCFHTLYNIVRLSENVDKEQLKTEILSSKEVSEVFEY